MKQFIGTALSLYVFANLTSCATAPVTTYNDKVSYASNLAAAAHAFTIKDSEVPKDQLGDLDKKGISDIAWLGAAGISPPPGVSQGFSLGITTAALIFGPKDPAGKSRVLVWVPKDLVHTNETPKQVAVKTLSDAYKKTAEFYGLQSMAVDKEAYLGFSSSKDLSKVGDNVLAFVLADELKKEVDAPDIVGGKKSYLYTTDPYREYASNLIVGDFLSINNLEFLTKLSTELPEWIVMYFKPDTVTINGSKNKFPFMMQKGKIHLFVIPK